MASAACNQLPVETWSQWASDNGCNSSIPYTTAPYDTSDIELPKWAHQNLVNGRFDVTAAVQQAKGWSAIQIALPIIVGVVVALIAGILFLWYRARQRGGFKDRRRSPKRWESANLHGPRRFFGLIPQRVTVKEGSSREPRWEIDGQTGANAVLDYDDEPPKMDDGRNSRASGHSRTTSSSALIQSNASLHSSQSKSLFNTIASKISTMSLGRKYQNGATKGSDYKRVQVVPRNPTDRFKIDGELPTPNRYDEPPLPYREEPAERQSSLPSVLDIRAPSAAAGSHHAWTNQYDSTPFTDDGRTDLAPPTVMHSDFSLATTDLMTPISSGASHPRSSSDPHRASVISPNSPFLPSERFDPMPTIRASPSPYIDRRESTDSLAHQLYPRDPSYDY
ncbi:hypothetical protein PHLGIDRAFT_470504 [Phlebiopsis gigantea 11061_1 CR5-6]|uniref:Uncharacterized protein n=1 Tax=Phlebiopsis gigantea (strain 11061_1 CR5-6) TaxID=745531 RepID=A0A0C3S9E1_PHLG1|nr:hypothetical protein PHLGIDRAFT_470504 [Phlebiopsis gigantea 11061_1 CR5-6]